MYKCRNSFRSSRSLIWIRDLLLHINPRIRHLGMIKYLCSFHENVHTKGATVTRLVQDPLAVLLLDNRLYILLSSWTQDKTLHQQSLSSWVERSELLILSQSFITSRVRCNRLPILHLFLDMWVLIFVALLCSVFIWIRSPYKLKRRLSYI